MREYISREEAEERLLHLAEVANSAYDGMFNSQIVMLAQNVIHMMPAADVRPNVTGRWVDLPPACNGAIMTKCSNCKRVMSDTALGMVRHYCPNCGAKMEES